MTEHWTESDDRALRVAVLDLSRLLRCMEQHEAPPDLSWQSIEGRANLALDLLRKVQDGFHAAVYESNALRAQDEARYVQLEHQVDRACRRAREIAAQRRENQVDLIQEIFFPKNDNLNEEEKKDNDADERPQKIIQLTTNARRRRRNNNNNNNNKSLQKHPLHSYRKALLRM